MKKRYVFLVGLVLVSAVLWWWVSRNKAAPPVETADNAPVEPGQQAQPPESRRPAATQHQQTQSPTNRPSQPKSDAKLEEYGRKAIATQRDRNREIERNWKAQFSAPISFFGKVLENEQPVGGATINFTWNDLPPGDETTNFTGESFSPFAYMHSSKSQTASDPQGLFSLRDKKGKRLSVEVSKAGYYSTGDARSQSFEYGDALVGIFTPDPANPVIFHLRKKGPGVDLVTSQYGVSPSLEVKIPRDGTPVQVDMLERKVGQGPLTVSQNKPSYENWKQATEWAFRMEMPEGGFIEQNDEFPFEAPETGYQPLMEFNFRNGDTNWTTNLSKDFYVRFGNPTRYGRLHVETSIMMQGARFTYAINPSGSRYLEPK
jgi:hypothetical protein